MQGACVDGFWWYINESLILIRYTVSAYKLTYLKLQIVNQKMNTSGESWIIAEIFRVNNPSATTHPKPQPKHIQNLNHNTSKNLNHTIFHTSNTFATHTLSQHQGVPSLNTSESVPSMLGQVRTNGWIDDSHHGMPVVKIFPDPTKIGSPTKNLQQLIGMARKPNKNLQQFIGMARKPNKNLQQFIGMARKPNKNLQQFIGMARKS